VKELFRSFWACTDPDDATTFFRGSTGFSV
jgi:hypothetical protein